MPYTIKKGVGKKPWKIVKRYGGETVGTSTTKKKAAASIRARYANEK